MSRPLQPLQPLQPNLLRCVVCFFTKLNNNAFPYSLSLLSLCCVALLEFGGKHRRVYDDITILVVFLDKVVHTHHSPFATHQSPLTNCLCLCMHGRYIQGGSKVAALGSKL